MHNELAGLRDRLHSHGTASESEKIGPFSRFFPCTRTAANHAPVTALNQHEPLAGPSWLGESRRNLKRQIKTDHYSSYPRTERQLLKTRTKPTDLLSLWLFVLFWFGFRPGNTYCLKIKSVKKTICPPRPTSYTKGDCSGAQMGCSGFFNLKKKPITYSFCSTCGESNVKWWTIERSGEQNFFFTYATHLRSHLGHRKPTNLS